MDVAVVGGGPAGARAACVLARHGARVTIFDPSHPREKPCGGGVTGRAIELVADSIEATSFARTAIQSARFIHSRGATSSDQRSTHESATVALARNALVIASRADFDSALLTAAERAGATLERSRVTNLRVDATGVRLETTAGNRHADFVIGADGANSLVRRRVAQPFRRNQLSIATGFFAHGITSSEIVIEFVGDPPGYIWSFPRPGHLAIGICAEADAGVSADQLRARTAAWIGATGIADGARLQPYAWPIPSLDVRDMQTLTVAGPRWHLVGDAAGLVDPITREGIYFALASGQWAAESLLRDASATAYASRVAREAGGELSRAARFKGRFFRPAFIGLMMRALQQSEGVRAVMADLVAGRQTYADLKWRLLKTFELGHAWRVLARSGSSP